MLSRHGSSSSSHTAGFNSPHSGLTAPYLLPAEHLFNPALPLKPGDCPRTDRPGLPARPVVLNQSRWSEDVGTTVHDPNDFYLPFSAQKSRGLFKKSSAPLHSQDTFTPATKFSCPDAAEKASAVQLPPPPGAAKVLDPTDDTSLDVVTPRSVFVGMFLSVVAASTAQLFQFKPVRVAISLLTLQLMSFLLGTLLSRIIPRSVRWLNPGPFTIKEDVFATLMAAAAAYGAWGTEIFAVQNLFLHFTPGYLLSAAAQFSNQLLSLCLVWLFRSFLVYPTECLYPAIIPPVILFQSLHGGDILASRRVTYFKKFAPCVGLWEILPQFLAPTLSALNVFCLCLPADAGITELFGGGSPNTGFGLFSLSLDWTNISAGVNGASPMYVPWIAQVNSWIGLALAMPIYLAMYKARVLKSGAQDGYPFLSTELLNLEGGSYNRSAVFQTNGKADQDAVNQYGLPAFTLSFIVSQGFAAILMTSAITQAIFKNWNLIKSTLLPRRVGLSDSSKDPHLQAMRAYSDIPYWFLLSLSIFAIGLGYLSATLSGSALTVPAMLGGMLLAAIIIGSIGFLNATAGFNPVVAPACQIIGAAFGGSVFRSLWFSFFSATCATIALLLIKDIKLIMYTKIPPWKGFLAQVLGTIIGVLVNQFVMQTIVSQNSEALGQPTASGQFSGIASQALFSEASTWSLFASQLYGPGKRYFFLPICLLIGIVLPLPFLVIQKRFPSSLIGSLNIPLIAGTMQVTVSGTTSGRFTAIIVGFVSQYYMRIYHSKWYNDYNDVLSAALDGGTQVVVLLLSFIVGGGAGFSVKMPNYFLNPPAPLLRDYCTQIK